MSKYNLPHEIGITLKPVNTKTDKTILVFGDSFGELGGLRDSGKHLKRDNTIFSWMNIVCQLSEMNVKSFGVSAASEELAYYLFCKTLNITREYTIICHSRFEDQSFITFKEMKTWDSLCNENTIHYYWTTEEQNAYKFKNGKSFYNDNIFLDPLTSCDDYKYSGTCANHMNLNGNLIFAKKIINLMKEDKNGTETNTTFT